MDKTAIKNYAVWARNQLIESCKQKAFEYGIAEDGENRINFDSINGRILTAEEKEQRRQLIEQISQKGYPQVMEEAAYTWFNRFIALRFMEVNGYLPSKVRVFTDEENYFKPEILKEAMTVELSGIDRVKVADLLEKQDNEELYKYLLITQCNALNSGLPYMFETISNWTELLFPANLLRNDSVIGQMINSIPEEDWTDQVQIIGWLYQYYNGELKDETFALLKKNVKITKERIPAATQLFTPDWIVRYMVENSLGRLWYEGHKDFDKSNWKYYLDEAEQEPEVEEQLANIREEYSKIKPEDIKAIDPCMGSGHILVYMFDILMQIYTSAGWSERDAAKSILENNLYGLDIDDRAGQLAYFAVMMKARKYNRRIMSLGIEPNVMSIQDSSFITKELIDFVAGNDSEIKSDLIQLKEIFTDAKEYGSILDVPSLRYKVILDRINEIKNADIEDIFHIQYKKLIIDRLLPLVKQAKIISQKYDVVATNPPYMGSSGMMPSLNTYAKKRFFDSKNDLSTIFMDKSLTLCSKYGLVAMINIPVWMFLSSYERLRGKLLKTVTIINMVHPGRGIFGSDFGTTTFVFRNGQISKYIGTYRKLFDTQGEVKCNTEREKTFLMGGEEYHISQSSFTQLPGSPIAYWLNPIIYSMYKTSNTMMDIASPKVGMQTSNNDKYLRLWHEINFDEFKGSSAGLKWIKYLKGGSYRKWYGNLEYILYYNYSPDFILQQKNARVLSLDYLNMRKCTWTDLTISKNSFRIAPTDTFYDISGHCFFPKEEDQLWLLGYANSSIFAELLKAFNSTIHCQVGDVAKIIVPSLGVKKENVNYIVNECVTYSKSDWDSFETSWDFKRHPLI